MSAKFTRIILLFMLCWAIPLMTVADSITGADTIKRHLAILDKDPDNKEAIKAIAFHYLNVGNNLESMKYGKRLMELAEKNNDREFCELYGHIILGATLMFMDPEQHDVSFQHLQQALAIAEPLNNHDALVSIHNSLGIYYLFTNDDPYTATSHYYSALDEAKKINDVRRQAIIKSNIAGCYITRNDISGCQLAEEAHETAIKLNEIIPLYYAKSNLIHFYIMSNKLDNVEKLIEEVEEIHTIAGFPGKSNMPMFRAQLHEKKGDIDKAYSYYAEAIDNFDNVDASTITATHLCYARLLRNEKRIGEAIKTLENALTSARDSKMLIHTPEILKELALCYHDSGNLEKAFEYSLKYQEYQDNAMNISRERVLQETRIKHDIYSREQQISEQKIELLASRNRIIVLMSSIALLLLLLGMLYYIHKKKDRLYSAIVLQNRDYINREKTLLAQIEKLREKVSDKTETTTSTATPTQQSNTLPEEKMNDLITRFTTCMIENKLFTDPSLTVASVADYLGTNRTYLSRAINESTGKTFTQIINEYRIREAIAMISNLEANPPLKQVAADVGFNSISTFYVTFQASTGMTPARYRSKLKEI